MWGILIRLTRKSLRLGKFIIQFFTTLDYNTVVTEHKHDLVNFTRNGEVVEEFQHGVLNN